jgi:hypothetical protein
MTLTKLQILSPDNIINKTQDNLHNHIDKLLSKDKSTNTIRTIVTNSWKTILQKTLSNKKKKDSLTYNS